MKRLVFASCALPLVALAGTYLDVTTDKDPVAYAVNETATLTFGLVEPAGPVTYTWKLLSDDGTKDDEGSGAVAQATCSKPGFTRIEATANDGTKNYYYTASVGFNVDEIMPASTRPADLRGFWTNRFDAITAAIDPSKVEMTYSADVGSCKVYKVRLNDLPDDLGPCTGWLSIPKGADSGTRYPADGYFFGYDGSWASANIARPTSVPGDRIRFYVMAHAFELEQDQSYYDAFKASVSSRGKTHGLDPVQNEHPETSYFNGMACRDIRAMLFLKTLDAWNGTDLTTTGHSQGGLQAVWAGMTPGVTQINPECPWNCDMYGYKVGRIKDGKVPITWVAGLDYYDPCFVGKLLPTDCFVNIVRAGLADYTCPPSGLAAFYNSLPQKKSINWVQGSGHSNYPTVWSNVTHTAEATAFVPETDDPDTKEYVKYVPTEDTAEDGWCGDISDYTGLTNRFVSKGGTWGANDQKYKLIQDAVTAANAGDVIWIHDGFVCKPESDEDYVGYDEGTSTKRHFDVTKNVTLRSVSGDARGHENPPILQGRFHDEEGAKTNPCTDTWIGPEKGGTLAIRAVRATTGTFKGIVIEHSAHGGWHPSYADSAIYGSGYTLDKCIIRDCHSRTSMLRGQIVITDCVISNNTGSSITGGSQMKISGTYFENNANTVVNLTASTDVGSVVTNCVFYGNFGENGGAMHSDGPVLVTDCHFTNNLAYYRGGAYFGKGTLTNCTFYGNSMYKNTANFEEGGGAVGNLNGNDPSTCALYDCTVVSNGVYYGSRAGGGLYRVTAYRTLIASNYVVQANGGGAADSILYDCQILNNETINTSSTSGGKGGGIAGGSATRCVIANNVATNISNTANCGLGGGAYDANLYNCVVSNNYSRSAYGTSGGAVYLTTAGKRAVNTLIVDNKAPQSGVAGIVGKAGTEFVNCTVTGNSAKSGNKGSGNAVVINSIVWNNTGTANSTYAGATNSCIDITVTDAYPNCISTDPQFAGSGDYPYALKDTDSPCVDTALTQQWMLEEDDPCSTALNGVDRIMGIKPDMGCYELYQEGAVTHTVTFDVGEHGTHTGGGDLIQLVQHKEAAVAPTVTPIGYLWKFTGWDQDFSSVKADMAINAVYEAIDPETVHHTVTFVLASHLTRTGGGELVQDVVHYHAATAPTVEMDAGWEFAGWDKDFSSVEDDMTVNAVQKRIQILPPEGDDQDDPGVDITSEPYQSLTNRFVSSSGTWGGNDQKYTDLEDAMKAAKTGDVIWMRNGFVEQPTDASDYVGGGSNTRTHFNFTKVVTVRSVSGDARNHPNPPRIRGRWHDPDGEPIVTSGANAIRALGVNAAAKFEGLVFEESSTMPNASYGGGCIQGNAAATFSKCIFRNNDSYRCAVIGSAPKYYDCVFSNNVGGAVNSAATYGCHFENNQGGAVASFGTYDMDHAIVISNCTFVANTNTSYGGAVQGGQNSYHSFFKINDCVFSNNLSTSIGGAVYGWATISNCVFIGNATKQTSSAGQGGAVCCKDPTDHPINMYDCIVRNNKTLDGGQGHGGGVYKVNAWRTEISGNYAEGEGGGAYLSNLYDCQVVNNVSTNRNGSVGGRGGGLSGGSATRCLFAGNRTGHQHGNCGRGGAVQDASLYNCVVTNNTTSYGGVDSAAVAFTGAGYEMVNCLVANNRSLNKSTTGVASGGDYGNTMINCTVVSNTTDSASGSVSGAYKMSAVNSIVWGNEGSVAPTFQNVTNCCVNVDDIDTELWPGTFNADPRFVLKGETPYELRMSSPCKNAGVAFGWMTDPEDVRSKDLRGLDRVIGPAPEMGCYEHQPLGMVLIVR